MVLGLTGGSGTGKSTASKYFESKGFLVVDSDKIAHKVCTKGEKCMDEIAQAFGEGVKDAHGNLNRAVMREIVFKDKEKLKLLNAITHKYIVRENINIIEENRDKNIVLDAPLLFEAGLGEVCTKTLGVLSDMEKRARRIVLRDGITMENATARLASQPEDEFYISRCDYVVYNNGSEKELTDQLDLIFGGFDGI